MPSENKEMVIFLRDDGVSIQLPDGQCAGYGVNGDIQVFIGKDSSIFPKKIKVNDRRNTNITRKFTGDES